MMLVYIYILVRIQLILFIYAPAVSKKYNKQYNMHELCMILHVQGEGA